MSSEGAIYVVLFPQKQSIQSSYFDHLLTFLNKKRLHLLMIQSLAKGKEFQSCHMNHVLSA